MLFLAECYLPRPALLDDVARLARDAAEDTARGGVRIRLIQAIFVPLDETCFVLYEAESAADVVAAGMLATLDFHHVAEALAAS